MDVTQAAPWIVAAFAGAGAFVREVQVRRNKKINNEPVTREEQRESKLAKATLDKLPDALLVVDTMGTILLVNSTTELYFGYHRSELKGREIEMLVPERFRTRHIGHRRGFWKDPHSRSMGSGSFPGITRDGEEFQLSIMLAPLVIEMGRFVIVLGRKADSGTL